MLAGGDVQLHTVQHAAAAGRVRVRHVAHVHAHGGGEGGARSRRCLCAFARILRLGVHDIRVAVCGQGVQPLDGGAVPIRLRRRQGQGRECVDEREEAQHECRDPIGRPAGLPAECAAGPQQRQARAAGEHGGGDEVVPPRIAVQLAAHGAHVRRLVRGALGVFRTAPGEHPVVGAQHIVRQRAVQPVRARLPPLHTRAVRQQRHERHQEYRDAQRQQHDQREPHVEPAQRRDDGGVQQPGDDGGEHGAQVQVLQVPDVVGHQPQEIAHAAVAVHGTAVRLHDAVQAHAQAGGHAEHPVVAVQALQVAGDGLPQAEHLHEHDGVVHGDEAHFGPFGRAADQVARREHEQRGAGERGEAQHQRQCQRLAVFREVRAHPAVPRARAGGLRHHGSGLPPDPCGG